MHTMLWAAVGWQAWPWLQLGLSTQRVRMYRSELAINRGVFAAVSRSSAELSVWDFNLDGEGSYVIIALDLDVGAAPPLQESQFVKIICSLLWPPSCPLPQLMAPEVLENPGLPGPDS